MLSAAALLTLSFLASGGIVAALALAVHVEGAGAAGAAGPLA